MPDIRLTWYVYWNSNSRALLILWNWALNLLENTFQKNNFGKCSCYRQIMLINKFLKNKNVSWCFFSGYPNVCTNVSVEGSIPSFIWWKMDLDSLTDLPEADEFGIVYHARVWMCPYVLCFTPNFVGVSEIIVTRVCAVYFVFVAVQTFSNTSNIHRAENLDFKIENTFSTQN